MANNVKVPAILDMFHEIPQKCGIEGVRHVEFLPISTADFNNPLIFEVSGSGDTFVDLARTYLQLKIKIEKDGRPIDKDEISTENLLLHTMWQSCDIQLQQKTIFNSSANYPYKSMLETLLTLTPEREKKLSSEFFYKDAPGYMAPDKIYNTGYIFRKQAFHEGGVVEISGPLHHDFAQMPRTLIPSGVNLSFRLIPARKEFILLSTLDDAHKYDLKIVSAKLKVCKVELSNELLLAHQKILGQGKQYIFPVLKTEITTAVIPQHLTSWSLNDVFHNRVPSQLIIAFVSSKSFHGDFKTSAFNFKNYDLRNLTVTNDGVVQSAMVLNYEQDQYIDAYQALYEASPVGWPPVNYKGFKGGYNIYVISLDDNIYDSHCLPPKRQGNISIIADFGTPLPENCQVLMLARFSDVLKIDGHRNIHP